MFYGVGTCSFEAQTGVGCAFTTDHHYLLEMLHLCAFSCTVRQRLSRQVIRGVARNLLRGGDKPGGLGDGSPPAGSRGGAPVRGLGGPRS